MASPTRAAQPSGRNVLEDLDSRIPTTFYWYLAALACVGGFLFGYDTSNIGSALGFIPYHLSSFATGYLVAGASRVRRGAQSRAISSRSMSGWNGWSRGKRGATRMPRGRNSSARPAPTWPPCQPGETTPASHRPQVSPSHSR